MLDPETFDRSNMDMERGWRMIMQAEADESRRLGLDDMPVFRYSPRTVGDAIARATPDLAVLIGLNLILFVLYFQVFMRYVAR